MIKFKKYEIIEISWVDSMADGGWVSELRSLEKITDEAMRHISVGYFLTETLKSYAIIQSKSDYLEQLNVAEILQIPKVAITKIRKLK